MIASGVTGGIGPRGWWAEHGMRAPVPAGKWILHRMLEPLRLLQTQSRPAHNPSLRRRLLVSVEPSCTTACRAPARRPA
jgi:hypothetical protein